MTTTDGRGIEDLLTDKRDELIQVWALHHLQIIGEAVTNLSNRLRNLVHQYFRIDRDVSWQIIERDIPVCKQTVAKMITDLGDSVSASL